MLSETTSEKLILESARGELAERGILGLRVASVARNAHCSITNIYRYFGDRDGLLARVLGDMYEEITLRAVENFMDQIRQRPVITVSDTKCAVVQLCRTPLCHRRVTLVPAFHLELTV